MENLWISPLPPRSRPKLLPAVSAPGCEVSVVSDEFLMLITDECAYCGWLMVVMDMEHDPIYDTAYDILCLSYQ